MRDPQFSGDKVVRCPKRKKLSEESTRMCKRIRLPVDDVENLIIDALVEKECCIIVGETGSGKSTQIPQLCLRAMAHLRINGKVAVTQPRRVAAISLAQRVASEMGSEIGEKVGYHVRFENCADKAQIVYITDGMLLRENVHSPFLDQYSFILVDEAHERSLNTDILLNNLRLCQRQRKEAQLAPLRIIIMSATMQADKFSSYFDDAPVYVIKGRTFPIDIFHANSINPESSDYVYNSLVCVKDIHQHEPITDDVLVFLTGREEIELAARKLHELNKEGQFKDTLHIVTLYAALSSVAQMRTFDPAPQGKRKIVLATNIAETSVTIPGIRIVIDCGKVKTKSFSADDRIEMLRVQDISKAQAIQRSGRSGREAPGKCYRLYPENHFEKFEEVTKPEILRSNLAEVFLVLLSIGLKTPSRLRLIDTPESSLITGAEKELMALGAVERGKKQSLKLTKVGLIMSRFPLAPEQSRFLLLASEAGCLEEALTIAALMSSDSVFDTDSHLKSEDLERVRRKFQVTDGDHITLLNVFQAFSHEKRSNKDVKKWCKENGLLFKNLLFVQKIRKQLREEAKNSELKFASCGADRRKLREVLAKALFMNCCEFNRQDGRYKVLVRPTVSLKVHPQSSLARSNARYIVFTGLMKTTDYYAREATLIDGEWVTDLIANYKKSMNSS